MKQQDYNLLDEPWIPVRLLDGSFKKMGIVEVFQHADDILDIACELPTQSFALKRILLAICYRVIPISGEKEWKDRWNIGLPTEAILRYLEKWRERFFLFGGKWPFMQVHNLRAEKKKEPEELKVSKIIADIPDNRPQFSMRSGKGAGWLPADEAAIWVVHTHAFDIAGIHTGAAGDPLVKGGKGAGIGVGWCGQIGGIWVKGETLGRSLLMNLVPYDYGYLNGPSPHALESRCAWEVEEPFDARREDYSLESRGDPTYFGIPRILTWQSRRIILHGSRSGVTGALNAQGDKLQGADMHLYEPMSSWIFRPKKRPSGFSSRYSPKRHEPGRAFWRDIPNALPSQEQVQDRDGMSHPRYLTSAVIDFHQHLAVSDLDRYSRRVQLEAVGMVYGPKDSTYKDLYHDEVSVSVAAFKQEYPYLTTLIDSEVQTTEKLAEVIGNLARNLALAAGGGADTTKNKDKPSAWQERYFAYVDDPFRVWLSSLDEHSRISEMRRKWHKQLRSIVQRIVSELIEAAPSAAFRGRTVEGQPMSVARAEKRFWYSLNQILPPQAESKRN